MMTLAGRSKANTNRSSNSTLPTGWRLFGSSVPLVMPSARKNLGSSTSSWRNNVSDISNGSLGLKYDFHRCLPVYLTYSSVSIFFWPLPAQVNQSVEHPSGEVNNGIRSGAQSIPIFDISYTQVTPQSPSPTRNPIQKITRPGNPGRHVPNAVTLEENASAATRTYNSNGQVL